MAQILTADQLNQIAQQNNFQGGQFSSVGLPTITPSSLQPVTPLALPQVPPVGTDAISANTSIASPIPTAESIINQGSAPTATDTQQTNVLNKIATLTGSNQTQSQLTNTAETAAGVPAFAQTLNTLNTQLQGLNDQATALQNEAQYTIPNRNENASIGQFGTAGINAANNRDLRTNQIKQGAIATQSLTLKSAIYGAQGQYSLAKDAADKAAIGQYEAQQQQLDSYKAQLDALTPTLNREEKARAAIIQSQLQDRQQQINNGIEDKKSSIALATEVLKNNPDNPAAQFAAQEALKESNQQSPDLQKVFSLLGQYLTNPQEVESAIIDLALQREKLRQAPLAFATDQAVAAANIRQSNASTANSNASEAKTKLETAQLNNASNTNISQVTGKPLNDTERVSLGYAERAKTSDTIISNLGSQFLGADNVVKSLLPNILKSSEMQQYEQAQRNFVNSVLRKESGAAISADEFKSASKQYFPQPGDSAATVTQKTANRQQKINSLYLEGGQISNNTQAQDTQVVNGKTYIKAADGLYYPQ